MAIDTASPIDQGDDTGDTECHIDHTLTPRPTETVTDDDAWRGLWKLSA
jgi:hypothetical protein